MTAKEDQNTIDIHWKHLNNFKPVSPGEILMEEFIKPSGRTRHSLAMEMGVNKALVHQIVSGERDITPRTAILLAKVFNTTPQFWMNLQNASDLYEANQLIIREGHKVTGEKDIKKR